MHFHQSVLFSMLPSFSGQHLTVNLISCSLQSSESDITQRGRGLATRGCRAISPASGRCLLMAVFVFASLCAHFQKKKRRRRSSSDSMSEHVWVKASPMFLDSVCGLIWVCLRGKNSSIPSHDFVNTVIKKSYLASSHSSLNNSKVKAEREVTCHVAPPYFLLYVLSIVEFS